jgi:hypothetical protein
MSSDKAGKKKHKGGGGTVKRVRKATNVFLYALSDEDSRAVQARLEQASPRGEEDSPDRYVRIAELVLQYGSQYASPEQKHLLQQALLNHNEHFGAESQSHWNKASGSAKWRGHVDNNASNLRPGPPSKRAQRRDAGKGKGKSLPAESCNRPPKHSVDVAAPDKDLGRDDEAMSSDAAETNQAAELPTEICDSVEDMAGVLHRSALPKSLAHTVPCKGVIHAWKNNDEQSMEMGNKLDSLMGRARETRDAPRKQSWQDWSGHFWHDQLGWTKKCTGFGEVSSSSSSRQSPRQRGITLAAVPASVLNDADATISLALRGLLCSGKPTDTKNQ